MIPVCTLWGKWPCQRPYLSCLIAVFVLLFFVASVCQDKRTNPAAQQGFWITVKNLSALRASLPSRVGDSSSFNGCSLLQTWSGSAYQFSPAWQRHKPHVRTPAYPVTLRCRPQTQASRCVEHVQFAQSCILWGKTLKEEVIDQLLTELALWLNLDHTLIYPYESFI